MQEDDVISSSCKSRFFYNGRVKVEVRQEVRQEVDVAYLDPVSVSVHLLLQTLQSLQQPVDRRQVASTVLIGQFALRGRHTLLHVVQ